MKILLKPRKEEKENLVIYSVLILIATIGLIYGNIIKSDFSFLRVWDYQKLLVLFLGIPFLYLQTKAKIPNFLEATISNKKRFYIPSIIGAILGILDILVVKVIQHPEPYTELPRFLQPFPYSLFW